MSRFRKLVNGWSGASIRDWIDVNAGELQWIVLVTGAAALLVCAMAISSLGP